jgi:hypothetical protein
MKAYRRVFFWAMTLTVASLGISDSWAQEGAVELSVLHIEQSTTTTMTSVGGVPTFLHMYPVLDGAKSFADSLSLTGTLSVKNFDPKFSEVLWALVYWQGECPPMT